MDSFGIEPRPDSKNNRQIRDKIISEIARLIISGWADAGNMDKEDVESDLVSLFESNSFSDDGYELAKELEDSGWEPDAELVEILDNVGHRAERNIMGIETENWIKKNDIKPELAEGDIIFITGGSLRDMVGEITGIKLNEAYYNVFVPVKCKMKQKGMGYCIIYENVAAATPKQKAAYYELVNRLENK